MVFKVNQFCLALSGWEMIFTSIMKTVAQPTGTPCRL